MYNKVIDLIREELMKESAHCNDDEERRLRGSITVKLSKDHGKTWDEYCALSAYVVKATFFDKREREGLFLIFGKSSSDALFWVTDNYSDIKKLEIVDVRSAILI